MFTSIIGGKLFMINKKLKDVLILVAKGKSNKEIALALNFSESYIKKMVIKLLKIYDVKNRVQLANEYNAEKMVNI